MAELVMVAASRDMEMSHKYLILVVEDETLIRSSTSDYLRDAGFHVIEAANAEEAMVVIGTGVAVDLVFTDVNLTGPMDGIRLAAWIDNKYPRLRTLVTSGGSKRPPDMRDRFVAKPYSYPDIESRIRAILDGPLPGIV